MSKFAITLGKGMDFQFKIDEGHGTPAEFVELQAGQRNCELLEQEVKEFTNKLADARKKLEGAKQLQQGRYKTFFAWAANNVDKHVAAPETAKPKQRPAESPTISPFADEKAEASRKRRAAKREAEIAGRSRCCAISKSTEEQCKFYPQVGTGMYCKKHLKRAASDEDSDSPAVPKRHKEHKEHKEHKTVFLNDDDSEVSTDSEDEFE